MRLNSNLLLARATLCSFRKFSTTPKLKQIAVPSGAEGKYASALYQVACEMNFVQIAKEMSEFKKKIALNSDLLHALESPVLSSDQKKAAIDNALNLSSASGPCRNFFNVLAENRRLSHTLKILNIFEDLVKKHNDSVVIEIVSAEELNPAFISRIVTAVKKIKTLCSSSNVEVKNRVDPTILGGFIVNVDDKSIDLSAMSKVSQINKILTETL